MMVTNNELIGSTLTTDAVSEAAAESEDNAPVGVKSKSHVGVKHRLGNCRGRGIIRVGVPGLAYTYPLPVPVLRVLALTRS